MKQISILFALLTVSLGIGSAATVTYNTNSSQLCIGASGCGVQTQTIDGIVQVTYNPIASATVLASPTAFASLGELVIACLGGGTSCGSVSLAGLNLFINVEQSSPTNGFGSYTTGIMTGTISGTASTASISWNTPNAMLIGPISYEIGGKPIELSAPNLDGGVNLISMVLTDTSVPEPSTYALVGLSLSGIAFLRRRKAGL